MLELFDVTVGIWYSKDENNPFYGISVYVDGVKRYVEAGFNVREKAIEAGAKYLAQYLTNEVK